MSNKCSVALAFVVLCGLALAPVAAFGQTNGYGSSVQAYIAGGLSLNNLGAIDLEDQALVIPDPNLVTYTSIAGSWTGLNAVQQALQDSMFNVYGSGTPFSGPGLMSTAASNEWTTFGGNAPIMGIGWLINEYGGGPIYTNWFGTPVPEGALLMRYTYMGDSLLRGFVDPDDENRWFSTVTGSPILDPSIVGGWFDGDWHYSGVLPTGDDDNWWFANIGALASGGLGGTLPNLAYCGDTGASAAPSAVGVPEPASIVLLLGGLIGLFSMKLIRRRAK